MKKLNRIPLAHLPTPIEALDRLSDYLGGPRILVKRDDQTGLALGGNKTRKLETLLADAAVCGAQTVITGGAVQSNHCRQTAAAAARAGLDCVLVLTGEPPVKSSGNLLLDRLMGAKTVFTSKADRDQAMQDVFEAAQGAGQNPYLIPYGGSNAIGAAAYALAVEELVNQGVEADWIVFASSSGGTHAGLVVGAAALNYPGKVLGISIDEPEDVLQKRVAALANQTAALLEVPDRFTAGEILVNADYLGEGYGILSDREREAVRMFARMEGLLLDPVYTGRAGAGLIDLIRNDFFATDQTVLFWHTGGSPALFADRYQEI